jgi:hypothetical protein
MTQDYYEKEFIDMARRKEPYIKWMEKFFEYNYQEALRNKNEVIYRIERFVFYFFKGNLLVFVHPTKVEIEDYMTEVWNEFGVISFDKNLKSTRKAKIFEKLREIQKTKFEMPKPTLRDSIK